MQKIDEYLQVKEAAIFLGVSPGTIRNWGNRGKLKEYRNPNNQYRLYKKTDLESFLGRIRRDLSKYSNWF